MKRDFFTLDNLSGSFPEIKEKIRLGVPTAVFGVADSGKYLCVAAMNLPVLYICADPVSAARAYSGIQTLSGKKCVLLNPKDDVLLYKTAASKDALFKRIEAICQIFDGADIVVCDVEAAIQLLPDRLHRLTLSVGGQYDYSSLPSVLAKMGYSREYSVEGKGAFAVHGDILDIFPVGAENPVRVDFFGDEVEKVRPYDIISGARLTEVDAITILPALDSYIAAGEEEKLKSALSAAVKGCKTDSQFKRMRSISEELSEKLTQGSPFAGQDFLYPILSCARTVFDVIPKDTLIIFDECKNIWDRLNSLIKEHEERFEELFSGGEVMPFSRGQYIGAEKFTSLCADFKELAIQTFTTSLHFFNPLATFNVNIAPSPSYLNNLPLLCGDVKNWLSAGYRTLIFAGTDKRRENVVEALGNEYIGSGSVPDLLPALKDVAVSAEYLPKGFILHWAKLAVVGSDDIFTKPLEKRIRRRRGDMFTAPEVGDFAVHEKHGVGRIVGTKKIKTGDGVKEYIALEYRGGDILYVPVEQMDILSKYVGEDNPMLSKIGGAEFERIKERVRQSVKKLAFDLKCLYAERSERKGFRFPENAPMMEEFESSFEYEPTPDQLICIQEIKGDMCSEKVMDRLLCGDVGYGKTEVALRAIYLCVLGGKQAALMCPSTILSEQHFNTAVERFKEFGLRIAKLNRFVTPTRQKKTLEALARGDIDLIIGTHRLLSADVKFFDLGLLVLDEEQRFGVEHKEKIKNIKAISTALP